MDRDQTDASLITECLWQLMNRYKLKLWDYRFYVKREKKKGSSLRQVPIVWERISVKAGFGDLNSEMQCTILFFLLASW